jgi:hypothetical protein
VRLLNDETWRQLDPDSRVIHYDFEVVNPGWYALEITNVGRAGPGLELLAYPAGDGTMASARTSGRLEPGRRMALGMAYRVTDCNAVPAEPWPVPIIVARPWGEQTIWFELPTEEPRRADAGEDVSDEDAWDEDAWWDGEDDEVEWQRHVADLACYPERSS